MSAYILDLGDRRGSALSQLSLANAMKKLPGPGEPEIPGRRSLQHEGALG
jgi:hypothetical protein